MNYLLPFFNCKRGLVFSFTAVSMTSLALSTFAASVWKEESFEDFRNGAFLDAGSNIYVSARGRIQMINRWDLNGDGHLDIVLPAGHGHTEKENTYIYLNTGNDIDGRSRIDLPGNGSRDGLVADFNKDGRNDLAVVNNSDSHYSNVDTWIYYGAEGGFSSKNRIGLPAFRGTSIAAGDFNSDGWLDLAIACQWLEGGSDSPRMSLIYWNSPEGFDTENRLPLVFENKGAQNVSAADLDLDGKDDLVALANGKTYIFYSTRNAFVDTKKRRELPQKGNALAIGNVNEDEFPDLAICISGGVKILFGSATGFDSANSITLPVDTPRDVVLADFDGDGLDDAAVANYATPGGATWTDSLLFYSDGKDFSTREPLSLPTLGANGISAGDLNGDGLPELVVSNHNVTNELSLLSYVFWNTGGSFAFGHHSQLATQGSMANSIGDVNNDGLPDVVFFNDEGGFRDGPSTTHIYWGDGTRNFTLERRTSFPTHHVFGQGHADLDDDGQVDLVLTQSHLVSGVTHTQGGLILCWGDSSKGFSGPSNLSMEMAYGGVRIADINKDGWLDMVAGGLSVDLGDPEKHGFPIFWGSSNGFQHKFRSVIQFTSSRFRAPLLMDLNKDGWLDLAGQLKDGYITIWWGGEDGYGNEKSIEIDLGRPDHLMYIKGADLNKDGWLDLLLPQRGPPEGTEKSSFIYYGSPSGFSNDRRDEIRSYVPYQNSIVDFDRDGWLDIFLTSYGGEFSGNRPSLIYWGSKKGFDGRPRVELPTYGSSGSETLDYDGDGYLDILIANHRRSGSTMRPEPHRHTTESMLYWGGPEGFSPKNRWEVSAGGPSGLNLRDAGNSYDRGLYEDYISSPHHLSGGEKPVSISWEAETPHATSVKFQFRGAATEEDLSNTSWRGAANEEDWYTRSGSRLKGVKGPWIQYRARLITPNGGPTPYLTAVSIELK